LSLLSFLIALPYTPPYRLSRTLHQRRNPISIIFLTVFPSLFVTFSYPLFLSLGV
jgi:hypothetical protein